MTSTNKNVWVYLSDVGSGGNMWLMNLETRERVKASRAQVVGQSAIGLRGYTLTYDAGTGKYTETGESLPMTEQLWDDYVDSWAAHSGWIADWPHYQIESSIIPEQVEEMKARLLEQAKTLPYNIEIIGLQRRFMMYYSDGGFDSQKFFDRAIPWPERLPYNRNGDLRPQYQKHWDHLMRDANAPQPKILQHYSLRPCLYAGPAWAVRVKINGVVPLVQNCRMYVDDEGNFIASDWCQRQDYHSYGGGINLQLGVYTFASWLAGPCINYATTKAHVQIPKVEIRQVQIRKVLAKVAEPVTFEEAMVQAKAGLKGMEFPKERKDPGPITEQAMMEAFAFLPEALEKTAQRVKLREADCTIHSQLMSAHTDKPTVLKDLIPGWNLVLTGSFVTNQHKKFPGLHMLAAFRKSKELEQHDQYDAMFMYIRDWTDIPMDTKTALVRDLRSTVLSNIKNIPGVYVNRSTGDFSDAMQGKVKPDAHPFSTIEISQVMLRSAIETVITQVPTAEVAST